MEPMPAAAVAHQDNEALPSVWGGGQLLALSGFSGTTDHNGGLIARTAFDRCGLDFKQPCGGGVDFTNTPPEQAELGGDYFVLQLAGGSSAAGIFVDAYHLLIRGKCDARGDDYQSLRKGDLTLVAPRAKFDPSRAEIDFDAVLERRRSWVRDLPIPHIDDLDVRRAVTKALLMSRTQLQSPEGSITRRWTTPDRWPHRDMWLWDSVFHAIGLRHYDRALARDAIHAVLEAQRVDGFIPHMISPASASAITQPPVLAFGVAQVADLQGDLPWVREIYPRLVAYLRWNETHRDSDGNGLLEWFIEDDPRCRSGESGMDNSPRFDDATQLDAVDFNAFMAEEYRSLSRLAEALGYDDDAADHRRRWDVFCSRINDQLWNEATGFYHDRDVTSGKLSPILANSGFLPLLCGAASPAQAQRLAQHLTDPRTFGTTVPVPSVAVGTRRGGEKDMWRGPVWININWLIAHGLRGYGLKREADRLIDATMHELVKHHARYGTFFEFYDDAGACDPPALERKGKNDPSNPYNQVMFDFGWSASLFIDMIFQKYR